MTEKNYVITVCTDSDFYLPNAEHIERNDDLKPWGVPDDEAVAQAAIADGICLIRGMEDVPDDVYIDTPENRSVIVKALYQKELDEEIAQNRARIYSDIPDCVRMFLTLEKELCGNAGNFSEWLRTAYEINEDFDESPTVAVKKLCTAFRAVDKAYGGEIARTLYNAQAIVLHTELMPAAMYLHCGGDIDSAKALASSGFFMESHSYGSMKQTAQFMAEGGAADEVYDFITQNKKEDMPQEDASAMSMSQRL